MNFQRKLVKLRKFATSRASLKEILKVAIQAEGEGCQREGLRCRKEWRLVYKSRNNPNIYQQMNEQTHCYIPKHRILIIIKEEWTTDTCNKQVTFKIIIPSEKVRQKEYRLCDSIYIKFWKRQMYLQRHEADQQLPRKVRAEEWVEEWIIQNHVEIWGNYRYTHYGKWFCIKNLYL